MTARREPGDPPARDVRLIDRLQYQLNGLGFTYDREPNLWMVEVAEGALRRLTSGASHDTAPAWSPDGRLIAFVSNRHRDADLTWRTDLYLVAADGGTPVRITGGRGDRTFGHPAWSPDGSVDRGARSPDADRRRLARGPVAVRARPRRTRAGTSPRRPTGS